MATKTRRRVTRRQAEAVLRAVEKQFSAWIEPEADYENRPQVYEGWSGYDFVIIWESGAPYQWAMLAGGGGVEEEFGFNIKAASFPKTVWVEPYDGYVLTINPAEGT